MSKPFVSCICPTYNRKQFLPYLIHMFNYQTYPKDRRELIILDDSSESNRDLVNSLNIDKNIKYIYLDTKHTLGKKRNMLNDMVTGEYIVCFDDDDFYPEDRVSHAITKMQSTKTILAGSTVLHVYYSQLGGKIYQFGPYNNNHATNGTMAYHKDFLKNHRYDDNANSAEEKKFLDNYTHKMVQLDPYKTILCIAHTSNTFDKNKVINTAKVTKLKLKNFTKDKVLLDFYNQFTK
jgi:glycosyltransferase involved in cell wall biosynthesis